MEEKTAAFGEGGFSNVEMRWVFLGIFKLVSWMEKEIFVYTFRSHEIIWRCISVCNDVYTK